MSFYKGTTNIEKIYKGSTLINKVYKGDNKVYFPVILGEGPAGTFTETWEINTVEGSDWGNEAGYTGPGWIDDTGLTSSLDTGPSNGAFGSDWYIYVETSSPYYPSKTSLISTTNFRDAKSLSFDYHMYGVDIGTLEVWIHDGVNWISIWTLSGEQQTDELDEYISTGLIDLSGYDVVKIGLHYTSGLSYRGDVAIDNMEIISI